jgi:periplasmic divalent cation tolerance protein
MFRNLRFVYITTKDKDQARTIGKVLVEERLAACVNILDGMESIYHWDDKIVEDKECVLIAKTPYYNVNRLTKRVKELHTYDVPCIISLVITEQEGNEEYLDWLRNETEKPLLTNKD